MYECPTCQHALEQHIKGEQNNVDCPCCRWDEPWETWVGRTINTENLLFTLDDPQKNE